MLTAVAGPFQEKNASERKPRIRMDSVKPGSEEELTVRNRDSSAAPTTPFHPGVQAEHIVPYEAA